MSSTRDGVGFLGWAMRESSKAFGFFAGLAVWGIIVREIAQTIDPGDPVLRILQGAIIFASITASFVGMLAWLLCYWVGQEMLLGTDQFMDPKDRVDAQQLRRPMFLLLTVWSGPVYLYILKLQHVPQSQFIEYLFFEIDLMTLVITIGGGWVLTAVFLVLVTFIGMIVKDHIGTNRI